jgi:hypothetical protein
MGYHLQAILFHSLTMYHFCIEMGYHLQATGPNGTFVPTVHYAQAQRINAMVLVYGKYLLRATSTSVVHLPLGYNSSDPIGLVRAEAGGQRPASAGGGGFLTGLVCNTGTELPICPDAVATYLVGQFTLDDGRVATLVMNQQTEFVLSPTAVLAAGITQKDLVELDPISGEEVPVVDADYMMPGLQLSIGPATIRFLIASNAHVKAAAVPSNQQQQQVQKLKLQPPLPLPPQPRSHLKPPQQLKLKQRLIQESDGSDGISSTNQATNFVQDRFAISFWVDPVVPVAEFPQRYAPHHLVLCFSRAGILSLTMWHIAFQASKHVHNVTQALHLTYLCVSI